MAEMKNTGFGLLSEFGLDLPEEKDVRSLMRQKRIQDAMKFVTIPQGSDGRTRAAEEAQATGMGRFGAALGNAFGEKFRQPQSGYGDLPPEIAARLNTVKATKEQYAKWEQSNANAPYEKRAEKYQEILAESAFQNGAEDIGVQVLRELQDRRATVQKRDAELDKLGLGNKYDRDTLAARTSKALYEGGAAGIVTVYPRGSNSPNTGVTGHMDPQGNVTITKDDGTTELLPPSKYTFDRPQWHPASWSGGGGGGGSKMTPTERGYVRKSLVAAQNLNDTFLSVLDLANEARQIGAGNVQGQFGKLTSMAGKAVTFAEQVGGLFSPTGERLPMKVVGDKRDYDMTSKAGRGQWIADNAEWVKQQFPGLELKARYSDRFIALITDLTYAQAMANEGGTTRSLSDNDFKQNFIAIGGNVNNPQTLTEILLGNSDRQDSRIGNLLSVYTPAQIRETIAEGGLERYEQTKARLDKYRTGEAWAPLPGEAPKKPSLPVPKNWDPADWAMLSAEEQASISR